MQWTTSLPVWGAWIEMTNVSVGFMNPRSLPVWGAWIEIVVNSLVTGSV